MKVDWVPMGRIGRLSRTPAIIEPDRSYRQVGVRGFGRGAFEYDPVPGIDLGRMRYFELRPNRLVVSNIKAWEGAVASTGPDEFGRIVSNRFLTYDVHGADLEYVKQWFLSSLGTQSLGAASPGSADRNRPLSVQRFEEVKVPIPDMDSQSRVAEHLGRLAPLGGGRAPQEWLNPLVQRATQLSAAILPATRNEIFNSMR